MGGDGSGGDVQFGSLNSSIDNVAFYNATKGTYMHIYCSSITIEGGADLAEPFKMTSGKEAIPEGAVVVIDEQNPGHLKMSDQGYDTHVAGVVSGANGINPGIQMQQQGVLEGGKNFALTGRVYVQADTSNGAIKPGVLLTTSSTPGHAMKVTDHARAAGLWQGDESINPPFDDSGISTTDDGKSSAVIRHSFKQPPEIWSGRMGDWKQVTHENRMRKPLFCPGNFSIR